MAELRRDPIIRQWVLVHTEGSLAPKDYGKENNTPRHAATCQFCPGRESQTPGEVDVLYRSDSGGGDAQWQVRVVPNKFPALRIEGNLNRHKDGLFDMSNGIGAHEVLIETPEHDKNLADFTLEQAASVIQQYQKRIVDLAQDTRFKYVVIFKNYGESAGTTVEHAHSQIIALPMIPKYVRQELEGIERYHREHQTCVFCDMIQQEIEEGKTRVVLENDDFIVFCPFVPRYAFECWVMPKKHTSDFAAMEARECDVLAITLREALLRLKKCLSDPSYNYYLHNVPVNTEVGREFHWHIEIVPKLTKTTGFEWGTGFYVVPTSPEAAAAHLREVS